MSIRKEENGTYTVQSRVKDWTGKTVHTKKRGFKKKKDAVEWEKNLNRSNNEIYMTVGEFVEIYYEDKKHELKERTIFHKKDVINKHILPYFGERIISEIQAADLIKWQNHLSEMNYKPTYLNDIHKHMSALFSHACKVYHLSDNPCKRIKRMGSTNTEELIFWTIDDYNLLLEQLEKGTQYYVLFECLFWTGMRIGELLAMTKQDIDIANQQIKINKTYYRKNRTDYITAPKTPQSNRIIEIPEFLANELEEYMSKLYRLQPTDRVFPIVPEAVQHKLKRETEKGKLKKIRIHSFRHSHAAYLIHQGVEPILIRDRLGHKDIRITLNTYGHLYPTRHKEIAKMLDNNKKGSNSGNC